MHVNEVTTLFPLVQVVSWDIQCLFHDFLYLQNELFQFVACSIFNELYIFDFCKGYILFTSEKVK